ncbi:tetratricopeptide repeat protein [Niveibacterium umoris]|uniref:Tetratricopeptide repeat protein n=1 Tax=Niveibacterium umoris TaxID=1193620 RepID=A0A840BKU3_9RHOO|nr:tetratricopeptide repeat protein [Niveibacterium umoris]MBB4013875.1 hypothetical protein [Niveibacterium umoris]
MTRTLIASLACATLLMTPALASAAEPTLHQVYQTAESGRLKEAEDMMAQVLRDHPNSAKAHFVEAEILAKEGKLAEARSELSRAERIAPDLGFAKPQALQSLRTALATPTVAGFPDGAAPSRGSPWIWVLFAGAAIAIFFLLARWVQARARAPQVVAAGGYGPAAYGYGAPAPGYGPAPAGATGSGIGSSMLGGLATGVAVGAGVVAGEALMHRVLDGGERHTSSYTPIDTGSEVFDDKRYDMGGSDFGVSDSGGWDDSASSGSDDWS